MIFKRPTSVGLFYFKINSYMKKYKQGIFTPINKNKCISDVCIYRSSLELDYMRWLDNNINIISWGSEAVCVPYIKPTDGKLHRYFIDFNFSIKDKNKEIHKFLVEIKPIRQCSPPNTKNRKNKMNVIRENISYATNMSKWGSAKQWADSHGYKFIIVTERDIKNLKN